MGSYYFLLLKLPLIFIITASGDWINMLLSMIHILSVYSLYTFRINVTIMITMITDIIFYYVFFHIFSALPMNYFTYLKVGLYFILCAMLLDKKYNKNFKSDIFKLSARVLAMIVCLVDIMIDRDLLLGDLFLYISFITLYELKNSKRKKKKRKVCDEQC